jgi:hypothetical protein
MQIAGSRCFVCGQNIGVMLDGAGCVACQIVVHKTCIGNPVCPKCEKPFFTAERIHSTQSMILPRDRPTSVTVLAWLAFLGVLRSVVRAIAGFLLMANDEKAGAAFAAEAVFEGIVSLALGLGLLNGFDWARRLYLWGSPIFIALALVLGETSAQWPGRWPTFSVAVVAYGMWAYFLTRPKAVAFFRKNSRNPVTA